MPFAEDSSFARDLREACLHASQSPQLAGEPALVALLKMLTEAALKDEAPSLGPDAERQAQRLRARLYEYREAHPTRRHHIYLPRDSWQLTLRRPGIHRSGKSTEPELPNARPWLAVAGGVALLALLVGAWIGWRIWQAREGALFQFGQGLPIDSFAVSPDEAQLFYTAAPQAGQPARLFRIAIEQPEPVALTPAGQAVAFPAVSAKGWLAYWRQNSLGQWDLVLEGTGTQPYVYATANDQASPLAWREGAVLASISGALVEVRANGVPPVPLTQPAGGDRDSHPMPHPQYPGYLFARHNPARGTTIYLQGWGTRDPRAVLPGLSQFRGMAWMPSAAGFYFAAEYNNQRGLWLYRFASRSVEPANLGGPFSHSPYIALPAQESAARARIFWLDNSEVRRLVSKKASSEATNEVSLPKPPRGAPVFSRNGEAWASRVDEGVRSTLYLWPRNYTLSLGDLDVSTSPAWSPDGRFLVFAARRTGRAALYAQALEGGSPRLLTSCPADISHPQFSSEGAWLVYLCGTDLYRLPWPGEGSVPGAKFAAGIFRAVEFLPPLGGLVAVTFDGARFAVDPALAQLRPLPEAPRTDPHALAATSNRLFAFRFLAAPFQNLPVPASDVDHAFSVSPDGQVFYVQSREPRDEGISGIRLPAN